MEFDSDYLASLAEFLPELPKQLQDRLVKDFALTRDSAHTLSKFENRKLLSLFMDLIARNLAPQKVANVLLNKADARNLELDELVNTYFGQVTHWGMLK